jgi:catalase
MHGYNRDGAADRYDYRADDDYYTQPGLLFGLMDAAQREALFANTGRAMGDSSEKVRVRHIANCPKADRAYGEGVAAALGIPMSKVGA